MFGGVWTVARRELRVAARQGQTYSLRNLAVISAVGITGLVVWLKLLARPDLVGWEVPPDWAREAARASAVGALIALGLLAAGNMLRFTSLTVAAERQKGTLPDILTTDLTAFDLIAGKLLAAAAETAGGVAAGVPFLVLLWQLGGLDPELAGVVLLGSLAFGTLAAAVGLTTSVEARYAKTATGVAVAALVTWIDAPLILSQVGPRVFPTVYGWFAPLNRALVASGPLVLLARGPAGWWSRPALVSIVETMAAWQFGAAAVLTAWTVVRLRPASRRLLEAGTAGPGLPGRGRPPKRVRRRPPCGDDPVLWKERHTGRPGPVAFTFGVLAFALSVAGVALMFSVAARPSWAELWQKGYAVAGHDARWELNQGILRMLTAVSGFLVVLVTAAQTVELIDKERTRDTWLALIATPLTPAEILRGKSLGPARAWRPVLAAVVAFWLAGAALGAIHPLGVVLATAVLFVQRRFAMAVGCFAAVRGMKPEGPVRPNSSPGLVLIGQLVSPIPCIYYGGPPVLALLAALSPPAVLAASLFTGDEVQAMLGLGPFSGLSILKLPGDQTWSRFGSGIYWVVATVALGLTLMLAATPWLFRAAERRFDAAVGRPMRSGRRPENAADRLRAWDEVNRASAAGGSAAAASGASTAQPARAG